MSLKNRFGNLFIFSGVIALFLFVVSLNSPDQSYNILALLAGIVLFAIGFPMRRARPPAPPRPAAPPPAAAAPPRKPGLLSTLLRGPAKPKTPTPGARPAAPPPPPPRKGPLSGLFGKRK